MNTLASRQAVSFTLLLAALAALPLFRGGYDVWPQAIFGITAAMALLLAPTPRRKRIDSLYFAAISIWIVWLGWQAFQLYPLPNAALQAIAPFPHTHWEGAISVGAMGVPRISLMPIVALHQSIASIGLFCFYLALRANLRENPNWHRYFLWGIVLISAFQALYGTLAHLTDWQISWLEPAPPVHHRVAHGSFPNRNHFAAFLIPGFACALALALGQPSETRVQWKSQLRRWPDFFNSPVVLLRVSMLIMVIAVILSQSRMGNVALATGVSVFALIWLLKTRSALRFSKVLLLFLSIAVLDVLLISERFGLERVIARIEETDIDGDTRSIARSMSWTLIERVRFAGAGHGTFAQLEHQVRPNALVGYLHHAHNDHLEFIIEFGWIGYGILATLMLVHLGMALRALSSRRGLNQAVGAAFLMCATAALLHASVEYIFHIPGWRASFVGMMALIASLPPPQQRLA